MKTLFLKLALGAKRLAVIEQANEIIEEYMAQGYVLTLRQLYYQFVSRDLLPNRQSEYKRLGSIISDGRLAGLIDWASIEDRTRNLDSPSTWTSPADILNSAASCYQSPRWADQPYRVEVWVEKEALAGVFSRVCEEEQVPLMCCRGYMSQSEMYEAGQRIARNERGGQPTVILHFGDHDPSGIDMTRDIRERLELFSRLSVQVDRLALNMDQVDEYGPPPNPAKVTDSRFAAYVELFGGESWELDALEPQVLAELARGEIVRLRDAHAWDRSVERDVADRGRLVTLAAEWRGER